MDCSPAAVDPPENRRRIPSRSGLLRAVGLFAVIHDVVRQHGNTTVTLHSWIHHLDAIDLELACEWTEQLLHRVETVHPLVCCWIKVRHLRRIGVEEALRITTTPTVEGGAFNGDHFVRPDLLRMTHRRDRKDTGDQRPRQEFECGHDFTSREPPRNSRAIYRAARVAY